MRGAGRDRARALAGRVPLDAVAPFAAAYRTHIEAENTLAHSDTRPPTSSARHAMRWVRRWLRGASRADRRRWLAARRPAVAPLRPRRRHRLAQRRTRPHHCCRETPWILAWQAGVVGAALPRHGAGPILHAVGDLAARRGAAAGQRGRLHAHADLAHGADAGCRRARRCSRRSAAEFSIELVRAGDPARPPSCPNGEASAGVRSSRSGWAGLGRLAARRPWPSDCRGAPRRLRILRCSLAAAAQAEAFVQTTSTPVETIERPARALTALLQIVQFMLLAPAIAAAVTRCTPPIFRLRAAGAAADGAGARRGWRPGGAVDAGSTDVSSARWSPASTAWRRRCRACTRRSRPRWSTAPSARRPERQRVAVLYEASASPSAETPEELAQGLRAPDAPRRACRCRGRAPGRRDEPALRAGRLDRLPLAMIEYERCVGAGDCPCGRLPAEVRTR